VSEVKVPDIGDFTDVPVIEILVSVGDEVTPEQGLITLESDKATMDVPAPQAGTVEEVLVDVGDTVSEGSPIVRLSGGEGDEGDEGSEAEGADAESDAGAEGEDAEADRGSEGEGPGGGEEAEEPAGQAAEAASGQEDRTDGDEGSLKRDSDAQGSTRSEQHGGRVVVIGSGPGGYTAAFRAADLGREVVLVERYESLGGVCLNVGCIPSKALLHAARVIAEAEEAEEFGISFGKPKLDIERLDEWKGEVVGKLTGGLEGMAKRRKVRVVTGEAAFTSPNEIDVDGTRIGFDHCIIAAGSRPISLPDLPDDERILDSTGALELSGPPKSILVVGGGIIGLEMACVYEALGTAVSVVELTDQLIPGCDRDLVRPLQKRIEGRYGAVMLGTRVSGIESQKSGLKVSFEGEGVPESERYERVLVAVGRRANGDLLDLDAAGVEVGDDGVIAVDSRQRTNVDHIYAIGDIAGEPMLAHKAFYEGKVAAEVIAGEDVVYDARSVPAVAYTDPEVAWTGLTETEAREQGIDFDKASFPWQASGRALALGRPEGLTKVLVDPESRRLLGAGVVGPNAGELIAEAALAIEMGADATDVGLTIHPHPTLSETMTLAAEVAEGIATDIYAPKR
jgi:dihydrolipoamide dehydrogenase